MLSYVYYGTSNLDRATRFYDATVPTFTPPMSGILTAIS
jgi:hypothetical protein